MLTFRPNKENSEFKFFDVIVNYSKSPALISKDMQLLLIIKSKQKNLEPKQKKRNLNYATYLVYRSYLYSMKHRNK